MDISVNQALTVICFVCGLVIAPTFLIVVGARRIAAATKAKSWPTVKGQVSSSYVGVNPDVSGEGGTTFSVEIAYTYLVQGTTYCSTRLHFGDTGFPFPFLAKKIINRYPLHAEVEVRYDPKDPASAVLDPSIQASSLITIILGLFLLIVGTLIITFRV